MRPRLSGRSGLLAGGAVGVPATGQPIDAGTPTRAVQSCRCGTHANTIAVGVREVNLLAPRLVDHNR